MKRFTSRFLSPKNFNKIADKCTFNTPFSQWSWSHMLAWNSATKSFPLARFAKHLMKDWCNYWPFLNRYTKRAEGKKIDRHRKQKRKAAYTNTYLRLSMNLNTDLFIMTSHLNLFLTTSTVLQLLIELNEFTPSWLFFLLGSLRSLRESVLRVFKEPASGNWQPNTEPKSPKQMDVPLFCVLSIEQDKQQRNDM